MERVFTVQTVNESVAVTTEGSAFLPLEPVNVRQGLSEHAATSVSLKPQWNKSVIDISTGWQVNWCLVVTACPTGRYGDDCARAVLCGDGAQNNPVTGRCVCLPGRRGENCGHSEFSAQPTLVWFLFSFGVLIPHSRSLLQSLYWIRNMFFFAADLMYKENKSRDKTKLWTQIN